jgi:hypothetical protein
MDTANTYAQKQEVMMKRPLSEVRVKVAEIPGWIGGALLFTIVIVSALIAYWGGVGYAIIPLAIIAGGILGYSHVKLVNMEFGNDHFDGNT